MRDGWPMDRNVEGPGRRRARVAGPASVRVDRSGRVLALSAAWFSDGARRRAEARRAHRCVECGRTLDSGRTPYCSRRCRWKFHGHYFWDSARSYVLLRDRYTCQACGARHRARELEVDHIVEIARGGAALEYGNLRAVCRPCHRAKTVGFLRLSHDRLPPPDSDRCPTAPPREAPA
jgi:5-methylcytosine-specific restriction endonuclease McrA